MENKNYSTVFEADLAYLRSLGDTSECKTEFEVRLKTLRKLGGDIQTTTPLLYEIEKKILDFLGGDSSLYDNIYFVRKAIAERQGVNTEGLHTIYAIAVASLNSKPVDIKYTITFKNYDGTILETQSLSLNEMPVYTGETPVKPSDEEYNYTFNGWLPEISPVSGNAEYVAQFEATAIPVNTNYVTFTAEQANSTIGLNKLSTNQTLEYSTDTTNWNTMDTSTSISLPNTGDEVYIRGILSADNSASDYTQFKMTGKIAASGNCNAIWNYQDIEAPLKKYCGRSMFYNCKLTKAPELPATELANYCYNQMFIYCSTLTTAPELPATTLAPYCYTNMFQRCTSITTAPSILPATELVTYCYNQMFNGCTKLTTAPILPATTLAQFCYDNMFQSCTSLVEAPILPATTLANYCYSSMFYGCTSLKTAPELPATTLAPDCYNGMFSGCTSLVTAPELPATTLANNCYYEMFIACTKLNKITCLATDISATSCTQGWLANVSSTGTFIKDPNMNSWSTGTNGIPENWQVENYGESDGPDLTLPYVTFTAEEANSTIGLSRISPNQTLEYSTDTTNWNTMDTSTNITLANTGDKVYVRGILSADNTIEAPTQFRITGWVAASGNCNAIWNYQDLNAPLKEYCGSEMFKECSLTTAPELPATELAYGCYYEMFRGCSSLTEAPELPATTLADYCYKNMFVQSGLEKSPILPAKTLAPYCYDSMFVMCQFLSEVTCLATDISATSCTGSWLEGAAGEGTFIKDPNIEWTRGSGGIPSGWTVEDYVG